MDDVRNDVAALMAKKEEEPAVEAPKFVKGEEVKLVAGAKFSSGKSIASWVFKKTLYVRGFSGENVIISTKKTGSITGTVNPKYLIKVEAAKKEEPKFSPYKVKVTASALRVRAGAGLTYKVVDTIRDKGVYTVVEEKKGWARLESRVGWISLAHTKRV